MTPGYDDLVNSAPTGPSGAHPDWEHAKPRILGDILDSGSPRSPRRWVAGLAAAAVLTAAVAVGTQFVGGRDAVPAASPSSTVTAVDEPASAAFVGAHVTLIGDPDSIGICTGLVYSVSPPVCAVDPLPVSGIDWADIAWREEERDVVWADATVTGHREDGTFVVHRAYERDDPAAPKPVPGSVPEIDWTTAPPGSSTIEDLTAANEAAKGVDGFVGMGLVGGYLETTLLEVTHEGRAAVETAVGEDLAPWLVFVPFFWPVADETAPASPSPAPVTSASPSPSPSPSASETPTPPAPNTATALLIDLDGQPAICAGTGTFMRPPDCADIIPLSGLTWDDVEWRDVKGDAVWAELTRLEGSDDGTTFHVTHAEPATGLEVEPPDADFSQLCTTPTQGQGTAEGPDAVFAIAARLPGYVGLWGSSDQSVINLAFTEGVEEAAAALAKEASGQFCVGLVDGVTRAESMDIMKALEGVGREAKVHGTGHYFDRNGSWIQVRLVRADAETVALIEQAVGEAAMPHLRYVPVIAATEG